MSYFSPMIADVRGQIESPDGMMQVRTWSPSESSNIFLPPISSGYLRSEAPAAFASTISFVFSFTPPGA
jgi:hypothetical protein